MMEKMKSFTAKTKSFTAEVRRARSCAEEFNDKAASFSAFLCALCASAVNELSSVATR